MLETNHMNRMFLIAPLLLVSLTLLVATGVDWNADLTWYDQHRIEQIALLSTIAFGVFSVWQKDIATFIMCLPRWTRSAFTLAFGLGLLSAVTANYSRFATLEWSTILLLFGLAILLGEQARRTGIQFDIMATRLIVALSIIIALKIMVGYLAAMVTIKHLDTVMLFEGTFSNRRFFGQVASMAIPLLAYPLLRNSVNKSAWIALFILLAIWWMLAIVSGTRGTWVAILLASVVLALWDWHTSRGWLKLQFVASLAGIALFALLFVWLPYYIKLDATIENRLSNLSTLSGRGELWTLAWTQIQAHPWLGIGPMHLAAIHNNVGAHPHNAILQLAAEWGIPAALMLILPAAFGIVRLLARLRQRRKDSPDSLLVCLIAGLSAASVQAMVDGMIVIPYTQIWLALIAGWALGVYFRDTAQTIVVSRRSRFGISILATLALIMLLNGVFPEILHRAEITQAYLNTGNPLVPPRYWAVGWIP